jgi:uncharacterized protein
MNKTLTGLLIVSAFVIALTIKKSPMTTCPKTTLITPNGISLDIEVAHTFPLRLAGLSNRDSLAQDAGMLFLFPNKDIHGFWMKGTRIPLDIIWLNDGEVTEIVTLAAETNDSTPQHIPKNLANAVLEINAEKAAMYGFVEGATVTIPDTCTPE